MATVRNTTKKDVNYKDQYRLYKCRYCSKSFTDSSSWYFHKQLHTSTELFECDQCPYSTNIRKYLTRHKQRHLPPTKHKCEACGKCFRFRDKLETHMRVHTGEKPFKCAECGKAFTASYSLRSHMYIHNNKKPFRCAYCDYACRDHSTLKKHEDRHAGIQRTYECSICHKIYKNNWKLKEHVEEVHFGIDIRKHACQHCSKAFTQKNMLVKHIQAVHEKTLVSKCQVCGRLYSKNNLAAHMRRHIDIKPYRCSFSGCKKRFVCRHDADRHAIIHYPDQQYPCDICGKLFTRKSRLDKHLTTHMEKKKCVECDYCGVLFYSKIYLATHIRRKHSAHRQTYECDVCGLRARNKPGLVVHLKYAHQGRKDKHCKLCGTQFKRHQYLKLHLQRTHNIRLKSILKRTYKKIQVKPMQIKEEPIDADYSAESHPEVDLLEIHKQELDERARTKTTNSKTSGSDIETSFEVELQVARNSSPETSEPDFKPPDSMKIEYIEEPAELEPMGNIKTRRPSSVEPHNELEPDRDIDLEPNRSLQLEESRELNHDISESMIDVSTTEIIEKESVLECKVENLEVANELNDRNVRGSTSDEVLVQDMKVINPSVEMTNGSHLENVKSGEILNVEPDNTALEPTQDTKLVQDPTIMGKPAIKPRRTSILKPKCRDLSKKLANPVKNVVRFAKRVKSLPNPDLELALNQAIESVQNLVPPRDNNVEPVDLEPPPTVPKSENVTKDINISPLQKRAISTQKLKQIKVQKRRRVSKLKRANKPLKMVSKSEPIPETNRQIQNIEPPIDLDCEIIEIPMTSRILEPNRDDGGAIRDPDSSDTVMEYSEGVYSEDITRSIAQRHRRERGEPEHEFDKIFIDHAMEEPAKGGEPASKAAGGDPGSEPLPGAEVTMEYSKRVLSEDITQSIAHRERSEPAGPESALDSLFIDHVLEKNEKPKKKERKPVKVSKEKVKKVNKLVSKMFAKSKARQEDTAALERARHDYNSRIQQAVMAASKKEQVNIKYFRNKPTEEDNENDDTVNDENDNDATTSHDNDRAGEATGKIKFCTHQCYICFKLFKTKSELTQHCKDHFDICSEIMLKKCPYCGYVTNRAISTHLRNKHNISLKINYGRMSERHNDKGSKYMYEIEKDFVLEVIPSVKNLNRRACMKIDAEKRIVNDKILAKRKLVRKGREWVVEKEELKVSNDYLLPEFDEQELEALKINGDSYEDCLKKLGFLAKKRGLKMLYPCQGCEKICQNLSALVLHKRKHEESPKAFKPKVWKARNVKKKRQTAKQTDDEIASCSKDRKAKSLIENRYAKPKPVVNKHKCDKELIKFYEENIKGKDIEFWQFLKIFNKMDREDVKDFTDLEARTDLAFGIHINEKVDKIITEQGFDEFANKNMVVTMHSAEIEEIIGVPSAENNGTKTND